MAHSISLKRKWLQSFGRRKGKNFNPSSIESLSDYQVVPSAVDDCTLEIGFGYGEHLLYKALATPDRYYIGCEVYLNGIGKLLANMKRNSVRNIGIWAEDARDLLEQLQKNVIREVYILFPDPWPKRKTNKRRLINDYFLLVLSAKMKQKGRIIIATDVIDYADEIERLIILHRISYDKKEPEDMKILTRYQQKSNNPITWFQCSI